MLQPARSNSSHHARHSSRAFFFLLLPARHLLHPVLCAAKPYSLNREVNWELLPVPRSSAMDVGRQSSRRRDKGRKGRRCSRLGMKTAFSPSSLLPPALSPPPPTSLSEPSAPPSSSLSPAVPASSPALVPALRTSSPTAPTSTVPPRPLQRASVPSRPTQGAELGAMPSNFPSEEGNQQVPNLWVKATI